MLFNSYEFLFLFLPLFLAGYYLLRRGGRSVFLTLASYLFYGWWDYRFCSLMLISTVVDFVAGKRIDRATTPRGRRGWLAVSLISNLSLLGFFKYFDLFASTFNGMGAWAGWWVEPVVPLLKLTLPVGISFYTFQSMSYSMDIYLGAAKPARRFWDFACYVALFPQLIAGPIVRYRELSEQLVERTHSLEKAALGIRFFILGLAKKVILADGVASLADAAFTGTIPGLAEAWLGSLAYAMQIYFDFSGYSDMAVGLGLLIGFRLPQNFNSPYKAISITDFWRRWHISLSSWLRDYLYIPLGGNRMGAARTFANLFTTMLLGGLWHGANWTFVIWGGYHGVLLALERIAGKRSLFWWAPEWGQRASTFLLVLVGWVFFRASDAGEALGVLGGMVGLGHSRIVTDVRLPVAMLVIAMVVAWGCRNTWESEWRPGPVAAALLACLFLFCLAIILVNTSSPFLYFQF